MRRRLSTISVNLLFFPQHFLVLQGVTWYWHFVDVVWLFPFVFVYWL